MDDIVGPVQSLLEQIQLWTKHSLPRWVQTGLWWSKDTSDWQYKTCKMNTHRRARSFQATEAWISIRKKKTKQQARNILSRGWFSRVCKRKNFLFITINWKWKWRRNKISCKINYSWRPSSCSFSGLYFAFLYSNSSPKAWFLERIWDS